MRINNNHNYSHNFLSENVLAELVTTEDLEIILEEHKHLEDSSNRKTFKKILQCIERTDLAITLDIYLAIGK